MSRYVYPAIFEPNELDGFCVFFPDLENVFTHGNDLPHAMEMAQDALCLMLYDMEKDGVEIPSPSEPGDIKTNANVIVNLVACDTDFYKKYYENKSVKINATIPLWLKEAAERQHINFSQILQNGIKEQLQLQEL